MRLFYLIKIMVRKVYYDEFENELELFINENEKLVISIKNENGFSNVFLDENDIRELVNEISILFPNF